MTISLKSGQFFQCTTIIIIGLVFTIKHAENQPIIHTVRYRNVKQNFRCNSTNYLVNEVSQHSPLGCAFSCLVAPNCTSFNAPTTTDLSPGQCELLDTNFYECNSNSDMLESSTYSYYDLDFCDPNPCFNDGVCRSHHIGGITTIYCVGCEPQQGFFCD